MHVADWGLAQNFLMRAAFLAVQLLEGFARTTENIQGKLPDYFREASFVLVQQTNRFTTPFGTLSLYAAVRD